MFEINFITEPGIQKDHKPSVWSYISQKNSIQKSQKSNNPNIKTSRFNKFNIISWLFLGSFLLLFFVYIIGDNFKKDQNLEKNKIINQIVDLIVESSYIDNFDLEKINFIDNRVKFIIKSKKQQNLQLIQLGFPWNQNTNYQIYKKFDNYFLSFKLPWINKTSKHDMSPIEKITQTTILSNKVELDISKNKIILNGLSSDIISFILKMVDNNIIDEYKLELVHIHNNKFQLKVWR